MAEADLDMEDDLLDFDWDKAKQEQQEETEEEGEEDLDTLLGGFLAHMNK